MESQAAAARVSGGGSSGREMYVVAGVVIRREHECSYAIYLRSGGEFDTKSVAEAAAEQQPSLQKHYENNQHFPRLIEAAFRSKCR